MKTIWLGAEGGNLIVVDKGGQSLRSVGELAAFVRTHYQAIPIAVLRVIGAVGTYMALREFGKGPPREILYLTRKGLDAVSLLVQSKPADEALQAGQDAFYEHLFPYRGSPFNEMISHAFRYITSCVDEVRSAP